MVARTFHQAAASVSSSVWHGLAVDEWQDHGATARLAQSAERKALNLVVVGSRTSIGKVVVIRVSWGAL